MIRWLVRTTLWVPAAALVAFSGAANEAWFERHALLPAMNPPPPSWTLLALRVAALVVGSMLAACGLWASRRATWGGLVRVGLALLLAVGASEWLVRLVYRRLPVPRTRLEAFLAGPDERSGWSLVPRRAVDLPTATANGTVRYEIDRYGDRASSADWAEDPQAPTIVIAGESVAMGHGLPWPETFAARLGERMRVQVVDVAVSGYASDQAHLRAVDALPRLAHPVAVVSTVLSVQLYRNRHDDRPHLLLRDGALTLAPASPSRSQLRQLFVNDMPYLSEAALQESLTLTSAILHATATAARERGAQPLFVFLSLGEPRPLDLHPEAFIVRALFNDLPYVLVDLSPERMLPRDFGHPDAEGARQIANVVANALESGPRRPSQAPY
jgi:hypothetical protein